MKDMKEEENFHERGAAAPALLMSGSADSLHVCVCRIGCSATQGEVQGDEQGEEQGAERQAASLSFHHTLFKAHAQRVASSPKVSALSVPVAVPDTVDSVVHVPVLVGSDVTGPAAITLEIPCM